MTNPGNEQTLEARTVMVELVMEPADKPRTSAASSRKPTRSKADKPTETVEAQQSQAKKLNLLVTTLKADADAAGPDYWKKSLKG